MQEPCMQETWTNLVGDRSIDRPSGGARRDRTDDLMLAKHALSQLSYGPKRVAVGNRQWAVVQEAASLRLPTAYLPTAQKLVGLGGLEPPTSRLSSARSNQLSYKPEPSHVVP